MEKLVLLGASDLGQLIAHHIRQQASYNFVGFLDDTFPKGQQTTEGPILGSITDFTDLYKGGVFTRFLIGIGYKHFAFRHSLFKRCSQLCKAATFIHSSCYCDPSTSLGAGTIVLPGCTIDRGCTIGENCLINVACAIAHDNFIDDNCFLGPGVTLAGFIRIGAGSFIGVGSTIIDNISLSPNTQTGGGAVVTKDTKSPGLYLGIPAKKV